MNALNDSQRQYTRLPWCDLEPCEHKGKPAERCKRCGVVVYKVKICGRTSTYWRYPDGSVFEQRTVDKPYCMG